MKIAIIGSGHVGMAVFRGLQDLSGVQEIVLCGRDAKSPKMLAEIEDYLDAQVLRVAVPVKLSCGGYDKTAGADIIIFCAGTTPALNQTRLDLVKDNVAVVNAVFGEINKYNREAIIICLSNPVDIITAAVRAITGRSRLKVIGTGTLLDTARMRKKISALLDLAPTEINMFVLGEHGNSSCPIWSSLRILGLTLDEYMAEETGTVTQVKTAKLTDIMRYTGKFIHAGKGHTAYGVAESACRIVSAIINDTHEFFPLSVVCEGEYDIDGFATSVPCLIGREGILAIKNIRMQADEKAMFDQSAAILRKIAQDTGLV